MIYFGYILLGFISFTGAAILPHDGGRIVGGEEVDIKDYPYTVSLQKGIGAFAPICGASIISDTWVLTAAHCVSPHTAENLSLRTASNDKYFNGTVHRAKKVIMHENWNLAKPEDNDIALIEVQVPFALGKRGTQKIKLANSEPKAGTKVTVTGWGRMQNEGGYTGLLRAVDVNVVLRSDCERMYPGLITRRMICARDQNKDSCQGDSGGPLVIKNGEQVGVVSWGYDCADPIHPGVYASVAEFRDWIKQNSGV